MNGGKKLVVLSFVVSMLFGLPLILRTHLKRAMMCFTTLKSFTAANGGIPPLAS